MPLYLYELDTDDGDAERFEFFQRMSDPPLTRHPKTGQPIRRVPAAPSVPRKGYAPQSTKKLLGDGNLERLGFTKYVKTDDAKYEKAVGKGPDILKGDG